MFMMASINRGQPLARHTNVVHHESGCLKADSKVSPTGCCYDVIPSKPGLPGRGMTEAKQPTCSPSSPTCNVIKCESKRCMTCKHLVLGNSFSSNLTNKNYNVLSPNDTIDCSSKNVIYLITCRKCGIQYAGKTSQTLRNRMNNHRNRLKQLGNFYLYNHFNSDGHCLDDILIMPI